MRILLKQKNYKVNYMQVNDLILEGNRTRTRHKCSLTLITEHYAIEVNIMLKELFFGDKSLYDELYDTLESLHTGNFKYQTLLKIRNCINNEPMLVIDECTIDMDYRVHLVNINRYPIEKYNRLIELGDI